jgi:hypothetical protein
MRTLRSYGKSSRSKQKKQKIDRLCPTGRYHIPQSEIQKELELMAPVFDYTTHMPDLKYGPLEH